MGSTLEICGSIPAIINNATGRYEGNLVSYFRSVFNRAENLCNPYHNFRHMCHVLWLCYNACMFYDTTLTKREVRTLLIAALFHDFDHTGVPGPDAANIERAIAGLKQHLAPEDAGEFENIAELIKATEFPHTSPSEAVGLSGQILRDADLSQALSVAWIQQVVFGLATEWGKTPLEVLKLQGPFHKNLKFSTEWAKAKFPAPIIEEKIAEAAELVALLTGTET
ncbi:MAG: hypothetical protein Q7R85_02680 [bacterium]|nr:hypothetical protein [bacterium]